MTLYNLKVFSLLLFLLYAIALRTWIVDLDQKCQISHFSKVFVSPVDFITLNVTWQMAPHKPTLHTRTDAEVKHRSDMSPCLLCWSDICTMGCLIGHEKIAAISKAGDSWDRYAGRTISVSCACCVQQLVIEIHWSRETVRDICQAATQ